MIDPHHSNTDFSLSKWRSWSQNSDAALNVEYRTSINIEQMEPHQHTKKLGLDDAPNLVDSAPMLVHL